MTAHPIKALLSLYDAAYQQKFGVRAPIVGGRDAKLAQGLLELYGVEQLEDWLGVFFRLHDPFIQASGYGFNIFACCIGKCITAKPPPKAQPEPPADVIEMAKSIARRQTEEAEEGQRQLHAREQELMAHGMSAPEAVIQASREWLKRQA